MILSGNSAHLIGRLHCDPGCRASGRTGALLALRWRLPAQSDRDEQGRYRTLPGWLPISVFPRGDTTSAARRWRISLGKSRMMPPASFEMVERRVLGSTDVDEHFYNTDDLDTPDDVDAKVHEGLTQIRNPRYREPPRTRLNAPDSLRFRFSKLVLD